MSTDIEIPAVCDNCLGPNPYVEMVRDVQGAECKLCTRPFTTFEWKTSQQIQQRRKRTIICLTCARSKNCCQLCMLDLTYGLDIQLRDSILKLANEETASTSTSDSSKSLNRLTKIYKLDQLDNQYENGLVTRDAELNHEEANERAKNILLKVAASKRNSNSKNKDEAKKVVKPQKEISKGDLQKIVLKLPFNGNLISTDKSKPFEYQSIFVFGFTEELPIYSIQNYFERNFNTVLLSMSINHKLRCGYLIFKSVKIAKEVGEKIMDNYMKERKLSSPYGRPVPLVIDGMPIRLSYGKPRSIGTTNEEYYKIASVVRKQMKVLAEKD